MLIISNGFSKFHLAVAAAEAHRRGLLTSFISGAYPTPLIRKLLAASRLARNRKLARLLARHEEIPEEVVRPLWMPEVVYSLAMMARPVAPLMSLQLSALSLRYYGRRAVKHVRDGAVRGARLYHYRAGFGHESVREARRLGLVTLCDHSIAHPAVLQALMTSNGRLPQAGDGGPMDCLWSAILEDIEQADTVLVNSDFVRETFLHQKYDPERLHVIYWGIDDAFLSSVPARFAEQRSSGPLRLLFAGSFERRKGSETIVDAMRLLDDVRWELEIAGTIGPEAQNYSDFLKDPRVKLTGWLPRGGLAQRMARAEAFVFPSLAEGSARVVFEAMACGCYVITTPNAGSVVEDGIHGRLIPAGDPGRLAAAIRAAAADRRQLAEVGARNAALVREKYPQSQYGTKLAALYEGLLSRKPSDRAA